MFLKLLRNKFLKNSILYTLGSMMTPLIGFIMLPFFTEYLTPAEYGVMTTVQALIGMLQLFLLLSLHGAVTRFFYDFLDQPEKQKEYLGTIYLFVIIFSSLISLLLLVFSNSIGSLLFNEIPIKPFYFYLVGLSWLSALLALPLALLRAHEKAGLYILINLSKSILVMLLTIYLITFRGFGAEGALISQLSITFIIVLTVFVMQFKFLKLSFNLGFLKQSLIFSLPLLPHVASGWIISSSDRIILEKFVEMEDLGIYALAAQISMVLGMFYSSVNSALVPRYTRLRKDGDETNANKLLRIFSFVVVIFGLMAIPVAMYTTKLLTSVEYHDAIKIIPILLLGQILNGFYFISVAKLFYVKKTKSIATSSSIAAVVNIIISLVLIPVIGVWGAVFSTIGAEAIRLIFIFRASRKY
ncbi:lipopolysaccharide biosynthesis protein [Peribacillus asahii]|uniref:lipopolysaccharide biosynthesis protein n=1 Tax=Peribacillus asahii TaxID=228899 RepID=UPI00207AFF90|nr:oligosaccharide flippase family protein [Peribacillus asahii]USK59568.1 oligosaccharide flippase family protein [Peribacillus asahii]